MKIYLDENIASQHLVNILKKEGFDVLTPKDVDLVGAPDKSHIEYCKKNKIPLLTKDAADFLAIHQQNSGHAGMIVIYEEPLPEKNMSMMNIARACANLIKREKNFKNRFFILNQYRK